MALISFRQGIVRHQTDTNNNPTFLQQVGQNVNLLVAPDPTIITFVHGTKDYLYTESVTVPSAWGPFVVGVDEWMYWDLNRVTGIRTFGTTTLEPVKAPNAPKSPRVGQHWFNTNFNKWSVWTGATWAEVLRVFAAKMISGKSIASVSSKTPKFTGTQVGLTSSAVSGALTFDQSGSPIMDSNKQFFTTEDIFVTGVPTGASLKVNNIVLRAIAQQPIGAFNVVIHSDYNRIVPAFPFTVLNRVYGITEEGANVGDVVNVVTEGVIFNEFWDWEAEGAHINDAVYIDNTGQIILLPVGADSLPVGAVIGKQSIIFDPTLYGTGGASGASVHRNLSGLNADDHTIYFNASRGDARYYPKSLADVTFSLQLHSHSKSEIDDFTHEHVVSDITNFAHTHLTADITDLPPYIKATGGAMVGALSLAANPTSNLEAATKLYVDGSATGLVWLSPISTLNLISDSEASPPQSPQISDTYIMPISSVGDWSSFAVGSVVVWDGTNWIDRGSVASLHVAGARFGIAMNTTTIPLGRFSAEQNNIAVYDNTGSFISFETPTQQSAICVTSGSSLHAFGQFTYTGSTWIQFGGATPLVPDDTTVKATTNIVSVKQFADGGINDVSHWQGLTPSDLSLINLQDTDLTTTTPVDGSVLVFDATSGKWVPGDIGVNSNYAFETFVSIKECLFLDNTFWAPSELSNTNWDGTAWSSNPNKALKLTSVGSWIQDFQPTTLKLEVEIIGLALGNSVLVEVLDYTLSPLYTEIHHAGEFASLVTVLTIPLAWSTNPNQTIHSIEVSSQQRGISIRATCINFDN